MNEQIQKPSPNPETHQELVDRIDDAAGALPEHVAEIDHPVEGITRINGTEGFVQHSTEYEDKLPDTVIGNVRTQGSVSDALATRGSYTFRSREGEGVEGVTAAREVQPRDGITRAGSKHRVNDEVWPPRVESGVYEHKFRPESRDKAAKLVTDLAIKQANKRVPPVERV
jgi:hypothetical protein